MKSSDLILFKFLLLLEQTKEEINLALELVKSP